MINDTISLFQSFSENFYSLNVVHKFKSEYIQNISINRDNIFPANDASAQSYLVSLNKLILEIKNFRLESSKPIYYNKEYFLVFAEIIHYIILLFVDMAGTMLR